MAASTTPLSLVDHGNGDAVLHGRERIERLEFDDDFRAVGRHDPIQADQRSVANRGRDVVVNILAHRSAPCRLMMMRATIRAGCRECQ